MTDSTLPAVLAEPPQSGRPIRSRTGMPRLTVGLVVGAAGWTLPSIGASSVLLPAKLAILSPENKVSDLAVVTTSGLQGSVKVNVKVSKVRQPAVINFLETDGYLSIEAAHYSKAVSKAGVTPWLAANGQGDRLGGVLYNKDGADLLLKHGADPKLGTPCEAQNKCREK